jgi:hypothetical protein
MYRPIHTCVCVFILAAFLSLLHFKTHQAFLSQSVLKSVPYEVILTQAVFNFQITLLPLLELKSLCVLRNVL